MTPGEFFNGLENEGASATLRALHCIGVLQYDYVNRAWSFKAQAITEEELTREIAKQLRRL